MDPPPDSSVLWIPSHPAQGSMSMQRYWAALGEAAVGLGKPVRSALPEPVIPLSASGRIRRAFEIYWAYPRRCRRMLAGGQVGVVHILDHSFAHLLKVTPASCKTVVTVHDLIPFREPAEMSATQMARFRGKMELLAGADRLVAVSNSTRDDLIEFLKVPERQITVIPNGVTRAPGFGDEKVSGKVESQFGGKPGAEIPFTVLSVGLAVARKNLGVLPDVFRSYLESGGTRPRLVRVGDPLPEKLRGELEGVIGENSVIECGRVSDCDLDYLYRRANALIFPSKYEGFGLPVLEAMAAGCPVVASGIPCHLEVGGDCVWYFAPGDAGVAGRALAEIAGAGGALESRVSAGKDRAAQFTWKRHLENLSDIYRELTG